MGASMGRVSPVPTPEGEKPFGVALGDFIPMWSSGDHDGHGRSISSGFMQGGGAGPRVSPPVMGDCSCPGAWGTGGALAAGVTPQTEPTVSC